MRNLLLFFIIFLTNRLKVMVRLNCCGLFQKFCRVVQFCLLLFSFFCAKTMSEKQKFLYFKGFGREKSFIFCYKFFSNDLIMDFMPTVTVLAFINYILMLLIFPSLRYILTVYFSVTIIRATRLFQTQEYAD